MKIVLVLKGMVIRPIDVIPKIALRKLALQKGVEKLKNILQID